MNPPCEEALRQAALTTFGDMCLALPSAEMTEEQIEASLEAEVRVGFQGTLTGELNVKLFGNVLDGLAQGMKGDGELIAPALLRDALGEIGNVICGNVLPLVGGTKGRFRIDPPRPALAKDPPLSGPPPQSKVHLGLDGGRAEVGLFIETAS